MKTTEGELYCESQKAWETWLRAHHETATAIWLKLAKKEAGVPSVTYAEALDVALCYGWIDGQKKSLGGGYWAQRFVPRRPRSNWSKVNCAKAEALIAAGKMRARGRREVDAAKADGRWARAYDSPRTARVPDDLRRALDASPKARDFFAALDGANRYAILYRVQTARRPETRARRIDTLVAMLAAGKKLH